MDKETVVKKAEGIEGLVNLNGEIQFLYDLCHEKNPREILEIGSYKGRSAFVMLSACDGNITCVDSMVQTTAELISETLKQYEGRFNIVDMESEAFWKENKKKFDFIFIDGFHYNPIIEIDVKGALDHLADGGVLCGHDYDSKYHSQLMQVVDENCGEVEVVQTLWRMKNA